MTKKSLAGMILCAAAVAGMSMSAVAADTLYKRGHRIWKTTMLQLILALQGED